MSKLREKLRMYIDIYDKESATDECELITDDFSMKFALWLANCEDIGFVDAENEEESVKQLLQIFKDKYYE